jgi:hypothetical protein
MKAERTREEERGGFIGPIGPIGQTGSKPACQSNHPSFLALLVHFVLLVPVRPLNGQANRSCRAFDVKTLCNHFKMNELQKNRLLGWSNQVKVN